MKLTFFGNGIMAKAMIESLIKNGYEIEVFGRNIEKLEQLKKTLKNRIETYQYDESINIAYKNIILCVKPYALEQISQLLKGRANLVISVLANTPIHVLQENIKSNSHVRAMPNIAASYKKSITTLMGDDNAKDISLKIMSSIGKTLWVESQKEFDTAMILGGSAPAFLAIISEALIDGAVKEGLRREDATFLTKNLFEGFNELLKNYSHSSLIKEAVMSPGGVTAKGIDILEEHKVRSAFMKVFIKS